MSLFSGDKPACRPVVYSAGRGIPGAGQGILMSRAGLPFLVVTVHNKRVTGGKRGFSQAVFLHQTCDGMPVRDLLDHNEPYVTVAELADYWLVSRKQIYRHSTGHPSCNSGWARGCCGFGPRGCPRFRTQGHIEPPHRGEKPPASGPLRRAR